MSIATGIKFNESAGMILTYQAAFIKPDLYVDNLSPAGTAPIFGKNDCVVGVLGGIGHPDVFGYVNIELNHAVKQYDNPDISNLLSDAVKKAKQMYVSPLINLQAEADLQEEPVLGEELIYRARLPNLQEQLMEGTEEFLLTQDPAAKAIAGSVFLALAYDGSEVMLYKSSITSPKTRKVEPGYETLGKEGSAVDAHLQNLSNGELNPVKVMSVFTEVVEENLGQGGIYDLRLLVDEQMITPDKEEIDAVMEDPAKLEQILTNPV